MAEHMFRIVEKKTGEVIYYQGLVGCNKAKIVERAKKWCASHHFEGGDEAAKKHQIEFSYFTWDNYGKWSSRRPIGRSKYDSGWRCTTVCNLEQTNGHISIGSLVAGKALDPDTAKKAKGGAWGELRRDQRDGWLSFYLFPGILGKIRAEAGHTAACKQRSKSLHPLLCQRCSIL